MSSFIDFDGEICTPVEALVHFKFIFRMVVNEVLYSEDRPIKAGFESTTLSIDCLEFSLFNSSPDIVSLRVIDVSV